MSLERKESFVIDRKTWLRGEGGERSYLLREDDGKMCCLGQASIQCGVSPRDVLSIRDICDIQGLTTRGGNFEEPLTPIDLAYEMFGSTMGARAMNINDRVDMEDDEREARLIALFSEHGITLTFEG